MGLLRGLGHLGECVTSIHTWFSQTASLYFKMDGIEIP